MNGFRLLRADEIDCRIGTIKDNGLSLLLYKDARCDMNILDETVGMYNWKREHSRNNANCVVSIWDDVKEQWVSKEDTGTESNTEAQKGLASDSFKRACFNWGIGRELYTAPFIWIPSDKCEIKEKNNKFYCMNKFTVKTIEYNDQGVITKLAITNEKTGACVFSFGVSNYTTKPAEAQRATDAPKKQEETDDGSFVPTCKDCGAKITVSVHDFSVKKFGAPYCMKCQGNHQNANR